VDWVDYKRVAIKYRSPYRDLYSYVEKLLIYSLETYSNYRYKSIEGYIESDVIRQYGIFLWHIAEMENLTVGIIPTREKYDGIDWGMIETGLRIVRDRKEHNCDDSELLVRVASWVRRIYPYIATETIFHDAMCDNRLLMIEKHHY